ncbi:MAG: hypothetical protein ACI8W1_002498 [Candidatus Azotimanducaceae bacterium]|jgi:hypothetical protein
MLVPSTEVIIRALENRYPAPESTLPLLPKSQIRDILNSLTVKLAERASENVVGSARILPVIAEHAREHTLPSTEFALLSCIDDCATLALRLAKLEPEVTVLAHQLIPLLSNQILQYPGLPLSNTVSVLHLLDDLASALIGWVPGLGRAGDKAYEQFKDACNAAIESEANLSSIISEVKTFLEKENQRIEKLESRLANSEAGVLRSRRSRHEAAVMINNATQDQSLTLSITNFLQNPWFDSVQLLHLSHGINSAQWQQATKITEKIVWVYQPLSQASEVIADEKQKLFRIIESLPNEIRGLLVSLKHDSDSAENALDSFEQELFLLATGENLSLEGFSPITLNHDVAYGSQVSRLLLKKVDGYQAGQWFSFEEENNSTRIKLVLKSDDLKQLVFTNRNGMKVMEKSFSEFAYYLSSGALKALNKDRIFSSTFSAHYRGLIAEHERQQRLYAERKAKFDRQDAARRTASQKAASEAQDLAKVTEQAKLLRIRGANADSLAEAKSAFGKEENAETVAGIIKQIQALHVGNWITLHGPDGKSEECKLAVRLTNADKMIFVSRAGIKLGEYSTTELAEIILAGQGNIQVENVEFEDTLAQVVTKLRQDRNKSYDDLTGE